MIYGDNSKSQTRLMVMYKGHREWSSGDSSDYFRTFFEASRWIEGEDVKFVFCEADEEPSVVIMKMELMQTESYTCDILHNVTEFIDFIRLESLLKFDTIGPENSSLYNRVVEKIVYFAGYNDDYLMYRDIVQQVVDFARYEKVFKFTFLDLERWPRQGHEILRTDIFPSFTIDNGGYGRYHLTDTSAFSTYGLSKWLDGIVKGEIEPTFQSQPKPGEQSSTVQVIVGETWDEFVKDDFDVLLLITAPWCQACADFFLIYDQVAKTLITKASKRDHRFSIMIGSIDGSQNDIPDQRFTYEGFPTLYLKQANKSPERYKDEKALQPIMDFLNLRLFSSKVNGESKENTKETEL